MSTHPVTHSVTIDDPELEEHYRKYESDAHRANNDELLAELLLGDASYVRLFRFPKYSVPVDMLREHRVALRHAHELGLPRSKEAHRQRAEYFRDVSARLGKAWDELVDTCVQLYGDHGPLVSGVYRDHFPREAKDRLRFLTRGKQATQDASRLHDFLTKTRSPYFTW